MSEPTDPNAPRTPEYPPQPGYYTPAPGYPSYPQGYPPGYPPEQPAQPYPYPQQPYTQPYQPYPGQYPPPPQAPKRSNRTLWIVLGSVAGALVLVCGVCAFAVFALGGQIGRAVGPAFSAAYTVGTFCAAEERQTYATAYGHFSTSLQSQLSEEAFIANAQAHDESDGKVTNCTTSSSSGDGTSISSDSVTLNLQIERSSGPTTSGNVTLVKEGSDFKIDSIDPALGLT
jgi:hypothetical protein